MCAEEAIDFPFNAEGQLTIDDGIQMGVRVKHCESRGVHVRIGLERTDFVTRAADLPKAFAPPRRTLRPLNVVLAVVVGFFLGAALLSPAVQNRLPKLGGLSQVE